MIIDENNKFLQNLLNSARQGGFKPFLQVTQMYVGSVYSLLYRLSHDRDICSTMTKNVFIFAWNNITQIRSNSSFMQWLHGIAIHLYLTELRSKGMLNHKILSDIESETKKEIPATRSFDKAVAGLSDVERTLLVLRDVKQYAYTEITDLIPEFSREDVIRTIRQTRIRISGALIK